MAWHRIAAKKVGRDRVNIEVIIERPINQGKAYESSI